MCNNYTGAVRCTYGTRTLPHAGGGIYIYTYTGGGTTGHTRCGCTYAFIILYACVCVCVRGRFSTVRRREDFMEKITGRRGKRTVYTTVTTIGRRSPCGFQYRSRAVRPCVTIARVPIAYRCARANAYTVCAAAAAAAGRKNGRTLGRRTTGPKTIGVKFVGNLLTTAEGTVGRRGRESGDPARVSAARALAPCARSPTRCTHSLREIPSSSSSRGRYITVSGARRTISP